MRLVAVELKRGFHIAFVDKWGNYLNAEIIYPINPLYSTIMSLSLNKSYEVIAWQKYKSSWFIEVIDIIDKGYIF